MPRLISFGLPLALILVATLLGAGLMVYAQTSAFTGDEGFHLLAAQLIDKGRRPYIDFAFPQTPLNAYFNAWTMRLFGQTWRVPHAAAITSSGAISAVLRLLVRSPCARNPLVSALRNPCSCVPPCAVGIVLQ